MILKDYLLALLTAILWGGNFIATKYGVDGLGVFGASLVRVVFVSILFMPFLSFKDITFKDTIKITLVYGIGFITCFNIAVEYTDNLPLIIILIQLVVPIGAILSYFYFGEKIVWQEIVGIVIAFFGVIIIIGLPSSLTSFVAIVAVFVAVLSQSFQMILTKKLPSVTDTRNILAWMHLLNIPFFLIAAFVFDDISLDALKAVSVSAWLGALYTGILSTAVGTSIWFVLLKKYPVNKVAPFMLFVPFFGVLFSSLFFGNELTKEILIGGALIITGVVIVQSFHHILKDKTVL